MDASSCGKSNFNIFHKKKKNEKKNTSPSIREGKNMKNVQGKTSSRLRAFEL